MVEREQTEKQWIQELWGKLQKEFSLYKWTFGFDAAKRRAGQCNYTKKKITMSKHFLQSPKTTREDMQQVLLHEIAHALVGKGEGHGLKWKKKARTIGCNAQRCTPIQFAPNGPYEFTCTNDGCQKTYQRHRCPKYGVEAYRCGRCRSELKITRWDGDVVDK